MVFIFLAEGDPMYAGLFHLLVAASLEIHALRLSYIQDVFLVPVGIYNPNQTTTINGTCDECECKIFDGKNSTNNVALNCFSNDTCQVFSTFPLSYKLRSSAATRLYFLQGIYPNASQCCMPNITELVDRLKNATPITVSLSFAPSAFGYDETRPHRAVAIGRSSGDLYWFNPWNMSFIQNQTIHGERAIELRNNSIFTTIDSSKTVIVLNEQTLASVTNITNPSFNKVRMFLFMNNSQTIMATTQDNMSVTILDVISPTQFTVRVRILKRLSPTD